MKSFITQVEWGCGFDAVCDWISNRSQQSSYISMPSYFNGKHLNSPPTTSTGWIGVYSSGSTGKPKLVWQRITPLRDACSRHPRNAACTWATCFEASTFAGIQVAIQAVHSGGKVLSLNHDWSKNHKQLSRLKPDILAATPTFLDLLIHSQPPLEKQPWQPRQITLGGEPLRSVQGSLFQERFPESRFTLIYASAEMGVIAKTNRIDGWYPIVSLRNRYKNWRINDGELELQSNGTWKGTGDHCSFKGDYFCIHGRIDRVVNVGGHKVNLDTVESLAESFPGINRALAYAKKNPITGNVIALVLEASTISGKQTALDHLLRSMQSRLPKHAWPRSISWGKIPEQKNGKRAIYPQSCTT